MIANTLSESKRIDKGEMRKAITASFIVVYLTILSILTLMDDVITDTELTKTIIGHFTYVVGLIIVFYFGSRVAEEYIEKEKLNSKNDK